MDGRLSGADGEDDTPFTVTEATSSRGRASSKIRLFWQTVSPVSGMMPPPALVRSWVVPSVGDHHGQGLKVAVALLPVILALRRSPGFRPHQLLMDGVVYLMDRERG